MAKTKNTSTKAKGIRAPRKPVSTFKRAGMPAAMPNSLATRASSVESFSSSFSPELPRAVAREAFEKLREEMQARKLLEGATTYTFLFNHLRAYLALAPERPTPTMGGEPYRLSPAGESLKALAKSTALHVVELCKQNGLPPAALESVYGAMVPMYLKVVREVYTTMPRPGSMAAPPAPRSPATPNPGRLPGSYSPQPPGPITSLRLPARLPGTRTIASPPRAGEGERAQSYSPSLTGQSMGSFIPAKSMEAMRRLQYGQRLAQLVRDLRNLLIKAPEMFGPIPPAKREYVEQLLTLIEEHERAYKAGAESQPFRFSHDEKQELEDFCPAFKLRGLEWLETENTGPQ